MSLSINLKSTEQEIKDLRDEVGALNEEYSSRMKKASMFKELAQVYNKYDQIQDEQEMIRAAEYSSGKGRIVSMQIKKLESKLTKLSKSDNAMVKDSLELNRMNNEDVDDKKVNSTREVKSSSQMQVGAKLIPFIVNKNEVIGKLSSDHGAVRDMHFPEGFIPPPPLDDAIVDERYRFPEGFIPPPPLDLDWLSEIPLAKISSDMLRGIVKAHIEHVWDSWWSFKRLPEDYNEYKVSFGSTTFDELASDVVKEMIQKTLKLCTSDETNDSKSMCNLMAMKKNRQIPNSKEEYNDVIFNKVLQVFPSCHISFTEGEPPPPIQKKPKKKKLSRQPRSQLDEIIFEEMEEEQRRETEEIRMLMLKLISESVNKPISK